MKKVVLIFVMCLFYAQMLNAQFSRDLLNRNEYEKQRLIYKEKNIRAYVDRRYEIKDGKISDTISMYELVTVDTCGNIIQKALFNKNREIVNLYRYDFNDKNENIKTYFIINNRLLYQTDNYFDLSHKLIERVKTNEFGSIHSKQIYFYNSKDLAERTLITGPSGTLITRGEFKYNPNNELVNARFYSVKADNKEEISSEMKIDYGDGKKNNISFTKYKPSKFLSEQSFVYKDDLISEINQTDEGRNYIYKREYITFAQKTRNIERWLPIPDYGKCFKKYENFEQTFKYKTASYFPGGIEALKDYIQANLKYPKKAGKQGLVIVGFAIDHSGSIGNIRLYKSIDYELDDAAIKLVKSMPKWKPALNEKGKGTMSSFILPVNFVIE
ncbi:MAG: energy transducer TonB [Bacteroidales bacterium]|nr:energy transducer TonB [Bacteroidales bacterium]